MATGAVAWRGIIPPISTPFTEATEIDVHSLQQLVSFLLDGGVDGIFALGSTGEAACLTDAQRLTVIETITTSVAGRVPVLVGISDMTTARVLQHVRVAMQAGADGLVLTAPYYLRVSQQEIIEHFRLVRARTHLPIFAYDIPSAVHLPIERATLVQLIAEGVIAGVKDSRGDLANFRGLLLDSAAFPDLPIFTGSELVVDSALMMGASGAVPGLANIDPHGYVRLYRAATRGDWVTARREQERLFRLYAITGIGAARHLGASSAAMGAFKTALMLRGIIAYPGVGHPMLPLLPDEVEVVRHALHVAELL